VLASGDPHQLGVLDAGEEGGVVSPEGEPICEGSEHAVGGDIPRGGPFVYNSATMTNRPGWAGTLLTVWGLALALLCPGAPGLAAAADEPAQGVTPPVPPQVPPTPRSVFGTIVGAVLDMKKKPMAGCMVQLSSRGEGATLRVTGTDEKGNYVFKDLPA